MIWMAQNPQDSSETRVWFAFSDRETFDEVKDLFKEELEAVYHPETRTWEPGFGFNLWDVEVFCRLHRIPFDKASWQEVEWRSRGNEDRRAYRREEARQERPPNRAAQSALSPYQILGLLENVELEVVDAAYRALAKKYHPDKGGDTETMKRINLAYQQIRGMR